ncbi:MAG: hypothetical protein ACI83O_000666 [Patescibacteria group bacterium]|jgi:hypothetical protein
MTHEREANANYSQAEQDNHSHTHPQGDRSFTVNNDPTHASSYSSSSHDHPTRESEEDKGWEIGKGIYMMPGFGHLVHIYDIASNAYETSKRGRELAQEAREISEQTTSHVSEDNYANNPETEDEHDNYSAAEEERDDNQEEQVKASELEKMVRETPNFMQSKPQKDYSDKICSTYDQIKNGASIQSVGTDELGNPYIITGDNQRDSVAFYESSGLEDEEMTDLESQIRHGFMPTEEFYSTFNRVDEKKGNEVYQSRERVNELMKMKEGRGKNRELDSQMRGLYAEIDNAIGYEEETILEAKASSLEEILVKAISSFETGDAIYHGANLIETYQNIQLGEELLCGVGIRANGLPVLLTEKNIQTESGPYLSKLNPEEISQMQKSIRDGELTTKQIFEEMNISDVVDGAVIHYVERGLGAINHIVRDKKRKEFREYPGMTARGKKASHPLQKLFTDGATFASVYDNLMDIASKKVSRDKYQVLSDPIIKEEKPKDRPRYELQDEDGNPLSSFE